MISNIVVSLFGAAYNWPLGARSPCACLGWWSVSCFRFGATREEVELLMNVENAALQDSAGYCWHAVLVFAFLYVPDWRSSLSIRSTALDGRIPHATSRSSGIARFCRWCDLGIGGEQLDGGAGCGRDRATGSEFLPRWRSIAHDFPGQALSVASCSALILPGIITACRF